MIIVKMEGRRLTNQRKIKMGGEAFTRILDQCGNLRLGIVICWFLYPVLVDDVHAMNYQLLF